MDKIDIVITWVDGSDPEWIEEKRKYEKDRGTDDRDRRYREWDILKYLFRGIEKNAPWVNQVFFVTCGQVPGWLNTEYPKLKVVKHTDFIPEEYLPTFSSRPIELNLHRIPGLSEQFVYFNDDMFLLKPTKPEDFFKNGLPREIAVLHADHITGENDLGEPIPPEHYYATLIYNMVLINRYFDKRKTILKHFFKWFNPLYGTKVFHNMLLFPIRYWTGLRSMHLPYSFLKSTYEEIWEKEGELMDRTCRHKFREASDLSSRLFSYWQVAGGRFVPRSIRQGIFYNIRRDEKNNEVLYSLISNPKSQMICINDQFSGGDYEGVKKRLREAFESVFPEKSAYERP